MAIDIEQLAAQSYVQSDSPDIMVRVVQGAHLDKLYRAAARSISAAEVFARAYDDQVTLPATPGG